MLDKSFIKIFLSQQLFLIASAWKLISIFGYHTQWAYSYLPTLEFCYSATFYSNNSNLKKSQNLRFNVKKKIYKIWKYLELLNANRLFIRHNFNAFRFAFSFKGSTFLPFLRYKNNKPLKRLHFDLKKPSGNYLFNYNFLAEENWYYLTGGLISPLSWDYINKFIFYDLMPAYDFVESEASLSENTHLKRKLILNNSFYNINSLLDYSNLAFTAVLSLETFVDEQNDTLASSPYLFLNNPDINKINFIYPNATVLELFDEYSSTFFDLKTALGGYSSTLDADMMFLVFYKTFWIYETLSYAFFELDSYNVIETGRDYHLAPTPVYKLKTTNVARSFKIPFRLFLSHDFDDTVLYLRSLKRLLRTSFYYSRPVTAVRLIMQSFRIPLITHKSNPFLMVSDLFISNLRIVREALKFYISYLQINKKLLSTSNALVFRNFDFLLNFVNYKNIRLPSVLPNIFTINPLLYAFIKANDFDIFSEFSNDSELHIEPFYDDFETLDECKNVIAQQPLFFTKELTTFVSDFDGFVFLNDSFINDLPSEFIYNFKKMSYSFISKNELHKYLLIKYSRIVKLQYYDGTDCETFDDSVEAVAPHLFYFTSSKWPWLNIKLPHLAQLTLSDDISKRHSFLKTQIEFWEQMEEGVGELTIKRIRLKPGYTTQLRNARSALKLTLGLNFRYQHRLTKYLLRFNKFNRFRYILHFEMQLWNILLKSRFACDSAVVDLILNSNFVYLNGSICNNRYLQIFTGDFLQLIVSFKYYILYRWFLNWSLKKRIKLKKISSFKAFSESEIDEKQRSVRLPNWILTNEGINEDTLKYVEIDYFTLSLMVLYEPFTWTDLNPYNLIKLRPAVMNLYNWKYIT